MADRPGGVTLVAVLAYVSGALGILGASLLLFGSSDPSVVDAMGGRGALYTSAVVGVLVGVVTLIVAGGLLRGNAAARAIIAVVEVLQILGGLVWLAVAPGNAVTDAIGVLVSVIVLVLLFSRRANAFFRA